MRSARAKLLDYLSYSARITAVMLTLCTGVALAQSSLFTLSGIFPVGSGALGQAASKAMVAADFNRDGKMDIVTANNNDGTLTLLLGDGAGHFTQAPGSPIAAPEKSVLAIATGDFNGDGNPDLVLTNVLITEILLGDGKGGFYKGAGMPSPYNIPGAFQAGGNLLAVGDFNGDGKLDLVKMLTCPGPAYSTLARQTSVAARSSLPSPLKSAVTMLVRLPRRGESYGSPWPRSGQRTDSPIARRLETSECRAQGLDRLSERRPTGVPVELS